MLPLFIRNHREVRDEWKKNGKFVVDDLIRPSLCAI